MIIVIIIVVILTSSSCGSVRVLQMCSLRFVVGSHSGVGEDQNAAPNVPAHGVCLWEGQTEWLKRFFKIGDCI